MKVTFATLCCILFTMQHFGIISALVNGNPSIPPSSKVSDKIRTLYKFLSAMRKDNENDRNNQRLQNDNDDTDESSRIFGLGNNKPDWNSIFSSWFNGGWYKRHYNDDTEDDDDATVSDKRRTLYKLLSAAMRKLNENDDTNPDQRLQNDNDDTDESSRIFGLGNNKPDWNSIFTSWFNGGWYKRHYNDDTEDDDDATDSLKEFFVRKIDELEKKKLEEHYRKLLEDLDE